MSLPVNPKEAAILEGMINSALLMDFMRLKTARSQGDRGKILYYNLQVNILGVWMTLLTLPQDPNVANGEHHDPFQKDT